jgi:hypothetical protein
MDRDKVAGMDKDILDVCSAFTIFNSLITGLNIFSFILQMNQTLYDTFYVWII